MNRTGFNISVLPHEALSTEGFKQGSFENTFSISNSERTAVAIVTENEVILIEATLENGDAPKITNNNKPSDNPGNILPKQVDMSFCNMSLDALFSLKQAKTALEFEGLYCATDGENLITGILHNNSATCLKISLNSFIPYQPCVN